MRFSSVVTRDDAGFCHRPMIVACDVHYEGDVSATAAAVVFANWTDAEAVAEYTVACTEIQNYVPGEFYKRELPCLLTVLAKVQESITAILIDGYVSLGDKPGLGRRLWDVLNNDVPIIGIAKTRYHSAEAVEINRGASRTPLFVTAIGTDPIDAAQRIISLSGEFRIPTLLKRVDQLARRSSQRSG